MNIFRFFFAFLHSKLFYKEKVYKFQRITVPTVSVPVPKRRQSITINALHYVITKRKYVSYRLREINKFDLIVDLLEDGADGGGVDGPLRAVGLQQLQRVRVPQAGRVVLDKKRKETV
jgi:hypothetical protein